MAIVQISKIQQRSGNLVDLPQLDEAEFGFASDEKRLFIGKTTEGVENIEVLTSYSAINFSQINGAVGNLDISAVSVADGQVLAYDGNNWVNRGGDAGGLLTLGDVSNVKITGGAIGYVLQTDGIGNLSWTPKGVIVSYIENVTQSNPAVVTTTEDNFLIEGAAVTITDAFGMTELNGNGYYADVLSANTFALYSDPSLSTPVDSTGYTSYAYTNVTDTTASTNYITVGDTSSFNINDPIKFVGSTFGGITANTIYYIANIISSTEITISLTEGGTEIELTTDSGSCNVYAYGGRAIFVPGGTGIANAAGSNSTVQFNNTNLFDGDADFTFNNNTGSNPKVLTVNGNVNVGNLNATDFVLGSRIFSSVATGVAPPFQVISKDRVSNLNVAYSNVTDYSVVTAQSTGVFYPTFVSTNTTGNKALGVNSALSFNALTSTLSTANLNVTGVSDLGSVSNVKISGGSANYFLQTDGSGNLSWVLNSDEAQNVLYVSKSGNDSNTGKSLSAAKLTIASAVTEANALQLINPTGTTVIFVKAGDYTEANPMSLSAGVSIVGDNLRAVSVRPATPTDDIFWVRNRCYITGMTFRDHLSPSAAVAFPSTGAGTIVTSPYVQNCSSITTTGCGMRVDGSLAGGLRSMVLDSYTQFNQGGLGIHITNQGYAQLVSIFSICCTAGVKCENGGTCSITNSNNSFGDYGLWAEGVGPTLYTGTLTAVTRETMTFSGLSTRPAVNDAVLITDGVDSQYILVRESTPLVSGVSTIIFAETLEFTPTLGSCDFKQISLISASSQTFEYVGTGTNILTATPRLGGIPIQANEIRETNGGRVNYTSTDQFGDFRIGGGLLISEEAGVIEGPTFDKSLFAVLTPYILALEG